MGDKAPTRAQRRQAERLAASLAAKTEETRLNRRNYRVGVAALAVAVIGGAFVFWRYFTSDRSEDEHRKVERERQGRPDVRAQMYPAKTTHPFDARFEITNESVETLRSPEIGCSIINAVWGLIGADPRTPAFTARRGYTEPMEQISPILPKGKATVPCLLPSMINESFHVLQTADIAIRIRYRYGEGNELLEDSFPFRAELFDREIRWTQQPFTHGTPVPGLLDKRVDAARAFIRTEAALTAAPTASRVTPPPITPQMPNP